MVRRRSCSQICQDPCTAAFSDPTAKPNSVTIRATGWCLTSMQCSANIGHINYRASKSEQSSHKDVLVCCLPSSSSTPCLALNTKERRMYESMDHRTPSGSVNLCLLREGIICMSACSSHRLKQSHSAPSTMRDLL